MLQRYKKKMIYANFLSKKISIDRVEKVRIFKI